MQNTRRLRLKPLSTKYHIRRSVLKKRTEELETAIKTVLHYISSHQVYDKDAIRNTHSGFIFIRVDLWHSSQYAPKSWMYLDRSFFVYCAC